MGPRMTVAANTTALGPRSTVGNVGRGGLAPGERAASVNLPSVFRLE